MLIIDGTSFVGSTFCCISIALIVAYLVIWFERGAEEEFFLNGLRRKRTCISFL